ncbi:MAG: patatin-like phospholipase family protein [Ignavibacteriales bacterium]|nr:patatin-like phospholipase family protein [Ignavibacteriales bacterium]
MKIACNVTNSKASVALIFGTYFGNFLAAMNRLLYILPFLWLLFSPQLTAQSSDGKTNRVFTIQPVFTGTREKFPNIVNSYEVKRPKIAVVLSGGGARGVAAVGVFRSFEKNNIPIDFIVGTSIGSVIGGLYAAGYSTSQLKSLVDSTNWDEVLSFTEDSRRSEMFLDQKIVRERSVLVLRFNGFEPIIPSAFSTGQRLTNYLNILTLQGLYHPEPSFDQLKIAYRAVTTDLISGKRIVIEDGDLTEAMRASHPRVAGWRPCVQYPRRRCQTVGRRRRCGCRPYEPAQAAKQAECALGVCRPADGYYDAGIEQKGAHTSRYRHQARTGQPPLIRFHKSRLGHTARRGSLRFHDRGNTDEASCTARGTKSGRVDGIQKPQVSEPIRSSAGVETARVPPIGFRIGTAGFCDVDVSERIVRICGACCSQGT